MPPVLSVCYAGTVRACPAAVSGVPTAEGTSEVLAASTVASAALVKLWGGTEEQVGFAVRNMPETVSGMICDGGCPGKKAVPRAKELVKRGADTIAFASFIKKGTHIGFPCPRWRSQ